MSSIKVVLYTSKTLKNGEHPIMLRITKDRKPKYISLNYSCSAAMWDTKNNTPKKNHPLYTEILVLIDNKKLEANRLLLNLNASEKEYSTDEIKSNLTSNRAKTNQTVFTYFDEVIKRLKETNRVGYAKVYNATKNSLSTFTNGKDFHFSDINYNFIVKYEEGFLRRGVVLNSIFVFMRTLKTLINYAKKEGVVKKDFDPFQEYTFVKFRRIQTKKRAISKAEIKKIGILKLEKGTHIFDSQNYFMFSYYCRGINFIDMAFLKWEDINNDRLTYRRSKSKGLFTMELLKPVQKILKYYKETNYEGEGSYVFPILNHNRHIKPITIDNRLVKVLNIVNKDLKEIAKQAKVDQKLTTYVARHSFATILKDGGTPNTVTKELMGHDSEKTTEIYFKSFADKVLDDAVRKIL